jgi:hypothetical protein
MGQQLSSNGQTTKDASVSNFSSNYFISKETEGLQKTNHNLLDSKKESNL